MGKVATLAAAYAEAGQFDEAVRWVEKALTDKECEKTFLEKRQRMWQLFKDKKPYRE